MADLVSGLVLGLALCLLSGLAHPAAAGPQETSGAPSRLCVVWSSGDPDVARNLVFMYVLNAKTQGWFDEVNLVVWGPSAGLLKEDEELRAEVVAMQEAGVVTEACIVCARRYDAVGALEAIGIDVKGMGKPLSDRIKAGWHVLTF